MAIKTRINPKTQKKEYKCRYYFITDGKKRDSETAWFPTQARAEKEAKLLKERKEKEDRNNILNRRDKCLVTTFEEFIEYNRKEAEKGKSNTYVQRLATSKAIYKNHFPETIQNIKIKDLSVFNFKSWVSYLNTKEELGGLYVRLCRQTIINFNIWLSQNNYYVDEDFEEMVDYGIRKVKLKSTKEKNKEENGIRNLVTITDFINITKYYYKQGIEDFHNFYYYTYFYILFFSGMRVEELTGLQWKFIDLRESKRTISIKNAISKLENEEIALARVAKENYKTKNKSSVRIIPIFDFYYELLIDYKESYKHEYNLTNEELEESFVFPRLSQNNPFLYCKSNTVLKELKRVLKAINMGNTDLQMFRHSCAFFLILPPPNGLGYTEEKVKDYFGHTDTKMLLSVYARLNTIQKSERMKETFTEVFTPTLTDEKTKEEAIKESFIKRLKGDNKQAQIARLLRHQKQIEKIILQGKTTYFYLPKDKEIIDSLRTRNKNKWESMEFVEENII